MPAHLRPISEDQVRKVALLLPAACVTGFGWAKRNGGKARCEYVTDRAEKAQDGPALVQPGKSVRAASNGVNNKSDRELIGGAERHDQVDCGRAPARALLRPASHGPKR